MRNAARRNELCNYSLTVEISGSAGVPAGSESGDALVPGTGFNATGEIPCARVSGQPMTNCKFGVVRQGEGTAQVTVFWPDGGNRVAFFEKGALVNADISQADGDAKLTSERQGDLTIARIGDQRFEIPDVVVYGD
ncbi:hypothetical protein G5V57_21650 [Nordella sp. HKS 07]|uniref:hypothetical protein n=1 Tax=Nordella sp. HKS 07 TaxID=2712222 RepID=UPI0013E17109|nr:hypothetical protein [Nordella sp. HKS 07]QIG50095.1 hypothetical protein G5V57_21650 [Nordella sp. HKS 07]